jgi:hypothetical protein
MSVINPVATDTMPVATAQKASPPTIKRERCVASPRRPKISAHTA